MTAKRQKPQFPAIYRSADNGRLYRIHLEVHSDLDPGTYLLEPWSLVRNARRWNENPRHCTIVPPGWERIDDA